MDELVWREFYTAILYHFPHVMEGPFREDYKNIPWRDAPEDLKAWQMGQTGYPIVDACMRQLLETGWMHNRGRMIVASFLTKDLLINWQAGEAWFMANLVDGDPAANNGGWQWSAGTGTDAAPYFRIFNPVTQGQKFDPDGAFIARWVSNCVNCRSNTATNRGKWVKLKHTNKGLPSDVITPIASSITNLPDSGPWQLTNPPAKTKHRRKNDPKPMVCRS